MWTFLGIVLVFVMGYVASVYTWPTIRPKMIGVESEITLLKDRINKLRGVAS
jgi:hypothetical protein